jgi:hypothetical protein
LRDYNPDEERARFHREWVAKRDDPRYQPPRDTERV